MNYLYNGREFPDIRGVYTPDLQAEYPCAYIFYNQVQKIYVLNMAKENPEYGYFESAEGQLDGTLSKVYGWKLPKGVPYAASRYYPDSDSWGEVKKYSNQAQYSHELELVWTANDIINVEDGSVYLAASTPIPVGGGEPIDPTSFYFLSGLFFAQKVRLPLVYKQLSLNSLCDINNILLKSLDDYFLIPNEKEK